MLFSRSFICYDGVNTSQLRTRFVCFQQENNSEHETERGCSLTESLAKPEVQYVKPEEMKVGD